MMQTTANNHSIELITNLRNSVSPRTTALVAGCITAGVYIRTAAPNLTWANFGGDGGELIAAAATGGIPHPPGYPLYLMIGKMVAAIPMGTVAWRFNLLSALSMAVGVAFVSAALRRFENTWIALAAALTIGFAPLLWGQALITEVYAFSFALVGLLLWAIVTNKATSLCGILAGLAVTAHFSTVFLLPLVAWHRQRALPSLFGGLFVGLLPLFALPLLISDSTPVIWGRPDTVAGWWWLVSAEIYRPNLAFVGITHSLQRLFDAIPAIGKQLLWVGWPLLALGLIRGQDHDRMQDSHKIGRIAFLCAIALGLYTLHYQTLDAAVHAIPAFALLSIALARGLRPFGFAALIVPLLAVALNFNAQDLSRDNSVQCAAHAILAAAPADALLMTAGDPTIFSLWYYTAVEKQRPDIALVDVNLFAFDWYRDRLATVYPGVVATAADDLDAFRVANSAQRAVVDVSLATVPPQCQHEAVS